MNTTPTVETRVADARAVSLSDLLELWIKLCNDFRRRERREIIEQEPSPEKLAQYRSELKQMLRSARFLHLMANDAEFPNRDKYAPATEGALLQFQESWETLNDPLTEAEAEAILKEAFPDERRTGSPASGV